MILTAANCSAATVNLCSSLQRRIWYKGADSVWWQTILAPGEEPNPARDRVVGEATRKQSGGTGTVRMRPKLGQKETLQMHIEKIQRDNPELPTPNQSQSYCIHLFARTLILNIKHLQMPGKVLSAGDVKQIKEGGRKACTQILNIEEL